MLEGDTITKKEIEKEREKEEEEGTEREESSPLAFWMLMESLLTVGFSMLSPRFCSLTVLSLGASKSHT